MAAGTIRMVTATASPPPNDCRRRYRRPPCPRIHHAGRHVRTVRARAGDVLARRNRADPRVRQARRRAAVLPCLALRMAGPHLLVVGPLVHRRDGVPGRAGTAPGTGDESRRARHRRRARAVGADWLRRRRRPHDRGGLVLGCLPPCPWRAPARRRPTRALDPGDGCMTLTLTST